MLTDPRRFEQQEALQRFDPARDRVVRADGARRAGDGGAADRLAAQPQLFRFECEDDAAVLEHVVALGERLGVSERALARHAAYSLCGRASSRAAS